MANEILFYKRKTSCSSAKKSTHTVKFIIILGQCFALLPVEKVLSGKLDSLRFKWKSFKTMYSILTIIGTEFMSVMVLYHISVTGYTLKSASNFVFYASTSATIILFMFLARSWTYLITTWTNVDLKMESAYGYPSHLERKLNIITLIAMIIATVEHQLYLIFTVEDIRASHNSTVTVSLYYKSSFNFIFDYLNYSTYMVVLVQLLSLLSTFIWTYSDLFLILLSTILVARFRQLTKRLISFDKEADVPWTEIREDYDRLCHLCKALDSTVSCIVLLSYFINIFFILVQLCYSLGNMSGTLQKVYFFYSFGFLILRTVAVSFYIAKINDESKEPEAILHSVPSSIYNAEVQRLLLQISLDNVALTGCKFFKVKRGLILSIAGAIITYELVLIQFNANKQ